MHTADDLIDQLDGHWRTQLRPRLSGLTDAEYLWEPVAECWSVRPRAQARSLMAAGARDVVADIEFPEPSPRPFTTIAWRMGHVAIGCLGIRASNHFGDGSVTYQDTDWPLGAEGGLALLDDQYEKWMNGVKALSPEELAAPSGLSEGPWSEHPMTGLVLHINREVIHHGAEISLLRDLYAHQSR